MGVSLSVDNGVVNPNSSASGNKKEDVTSKNQLESTKDMFMQLLVAEMQYQDPLEPTDNSQYIQQLYSMSQTESVLAVQQSVDDMANNALVGQYVTILNPETGESVTGKVDYLTELNGVKYVNINGENYEAANVAEVVDAKYYEATTNAAKLKEMVDKLPDVGKLTIGHKEKVEEALNVLSKMDEYQESFVPEKTLDRLAEIYARMSELVKAQQSIQESENANSTGDEAGNQETSGSEGESNIE